MKYRDAHLGLITLALAVAALLVPLAGASTATVQDVQALSADATLNACVADSLERDTRIAVNPTDPKNIVASWNQDRPLAQVPVIAVSRDGGHRWRQVVVPGHTGCSEGEAGTSAYDPAVAFGADGTLYVGSLNSPFPIPGQDRVLISRLTFSPDGRENWSGPAAVPTRNNAVRHSLWLAADPSDSKIAYAVWYEEDSGGRRLEFSKTVDGGDHWDDAESLYNPASVAKARDPVLRVLPGAGLLIVFAELDQGKKPPWRILAIRSTDGGLSWSDEMPAEIGSACDNPPKDPDTQQPADFARPNPSLDVRGRTAYVAWHSLGVCSGHERSQILAAKSTDDGARWTSASPVKADSAQAFMPTLSVGPTGVIGVTYYDFRRNVPDDGQLTTDVWFSHSHDGGASWKERHLAGPFDLISTPPTPGTDPSGLTDFNGLAPLPRGFAASFVQMPPAAPEPPIDVFFARVFVPAEGKGEKTSGGGWLADRAGEKMNFGFSARETAFGFEGGLQLNDTAAGSKIDLTEVSSLGAVGAGCESFQAGEHALELRGSGTYNGGVASFRVCLQDEDEPGSGADRFYLACTAGCRYTTASRALDDVIDGGNIQVGQGGDEPHPATVILDPLLLTEASVGQALTLTVRVYDGNQEPLPDTSVTLTRRTSSRGVETLTELTDGNGTAAFLTVTLADVAEVRATAGKAESNAIEVTPLVP